MTGPKVLADALVEEGILKCWHDGAYSIESDDGRIVGDADKMTSEWRVAGKVLESMEPVEISLMVLNAGSSEVMRNPRAICEAWYAAKENDV